VKQKTSPVKKEKQLAWKALNRNINLTNIINYRRLNAKYRFKIKRRKSEASSSFTSTIQPENPSSKIWGNIRRFCGLLPTLLPTPSSNPLIYTPNINLTDINRHLKLEFLTRNKLNIEHCNQYKNINKDNSNKQIPSQIDQTRSN